MAIRISPYYPELSDACLALERACPQGGAYRLSFRRQAFHLRAQSFDNWEILVASHRDRVVGTVAWALKTVVLHGEPVPAAFFFDLRVHPDFRRQGLGKRLTQEGLQRAQDAGALLRYTYCIEDNHALRRLAELFDSPRSGGYRYLVWPVYHPRPVEQVPQPADPREVHDACLAASGPFDFYSAPFAGGRLQGHVASFLGTGAGCSVWSNAGLLEEVVETIPGFYRLARRLLTSWPLYLVPRPHIPATGEVLQSWYVFDFFAESSQAACNLMRHVNNVALERRINYCYVIHQPGQAWIANLRADSPRLFSPVIPYCLLASMADGPLPQVDRLYVDIRDL